MAFHRYGYSIHNTTPVMASLSCSSPLRWCQRLSAFFTSFHAIERMLLRETRPQVFPCAAARCGRRLRSGI